MKKFVNILHSNLIFGLLFLIAFFYIYFSFQFQKSSYIGNENIVWGVILSKKEEVNHITLEIKAKEKLIVTYYGENLEKMKNFQLGDTIKVIGKMKIPNQNRNFNLFNYKTYLKGKNINWVMNAEEIIFVKHGNLFYKIKNNMINRIKKQANTSFLMAFILGDSSYLEEKKIYQELGISHLFAVSGMHITFITGFLFWIMNKISKNKMISFLIVSIILGFYILLLYDSASASRAYLLFLCSFLNKYYKFHFSSLKLLGFVCLLLVFKNPFVILQTGFQFSFLICFFLMLKKENISSYWKALFYTSVLASIVSFPLSVYQFHQFYFGSIFCNMIAVPFVSFLLFPLSFLSFLFPIMHIFLTIFIAFFHFILHLFMKLSFLRLAFIAVPTLIIILYYVILFLGIKSNKKWLLLFVICLFLHFFYPYLDNHYYIDVIDVGQGDSILFRYPHLSKTVLVDTGGRISYGNDITQNSEVDTILLPYFKSLGITKIDVLILTHGDADHMGNALELVKKFHIKKVYINRHTDQELEISLLSFLKKRNISYSKISKENIKIGKKVFQFLNSGDNNENEDSLVFYTNLQNKNILFMGDAGEKTENLLIQEYNLPKIDILKVGHHGSKNSSSKQFLDIINPKVALISAGVNNVYGHPHQEVLDALSNSKIYRTDLNGGIEIKLDKNGYKIRTCNP